MDTSVFISALRSGGGASRKVLRQSLQGKLLPLIGNALYLEYEAVMNREDIIKQCPLNLKECNELLDAFLSMCQWVHIYYGWRPNLADEADNHIIELAVAGNAKMIVTHNTKDFKRNELLFSEIDIVQPAKLLEVV